MFVLKQNSPYKNQEDYKETVEDWQLFLRGQEYDIVADGDFGPATKAATENFQRDNSLGVDGKVGRNTYSVAMGLGFDPTTDDDSQQPSHSGGRLSSPGSSKRKAFFGDFAYVHAPRPGNQERIRITDGWDRRNIEKINISQLIGVNGAPESGNVYFNSKVSDHLIALFKEWDEEGLIDSVLTWSGSYVPRFIRGSRTTLSNHAYGSAFDINYSWNKLGAYPARVGRTGSVRELVPIAEKHGFYWGGNYRRRKDGMHFEYADF